MTARLIKDFEKYSVTDDGRVFRNKTNRRLKPDLNSCGYERVTLHQDGKRRRVFIHRLVAEAFLPIPEFEEGRLEVNHINGIKSDNHVDNLEWCNGSMNKQHALEHGLRQQCQEHVNAKITDEEVHGLCAMIQMGYKQGEILRMFPNVTRHQFADIRRRKTWKKISKDYIW